MATKKDTYIEAVGRRKTATARVRITEGAKTSQEINGKSLADYFVTKELQRTAMRPFEVLKEAGVALDTYAITVVVHGSGIASQAGAVSHGIARALVDSNPQLRGELKRAGLLTRDDRMKERRKFGLKKARKSPQWSKR